jgi:hypothetical protein
MSYISSVSFVVLINGVETHFFQAERGLRYGCPLPPLLFLLVAGGLRRALKEAKSIKKFIGIPLNHLLSLTYLLFVDDVLIFLNGLRVDAEQLRSIL